MFTFLRLSKDASGGVAIIFSFALPVIVGITALSIDAAGFQRQHAVLQSIADTSALAIAKELPLFQIETRGTPGFGRSARGNAARAYEIRQS